MDIEGTYTLQASPEEVWQCLMDQEILQHSIPGLERLETVGEHTHMFTLHIKQAPLRGVYQGRVVVDALRFPVAYRLSLEGDGQHNTFQGIWEIALSAQHENTVVAYTGTLNPGKMGALLPLPLIKGTIKILIQQFFSSLAEQMRAGGGATVQALALASFYEEQDRYFNGRVTIAASAPDQTRLHTLVRQIGLGSHDPIQEDVWVARLKRFGAFSALLLLVWVGTRLPRRL
ncbi:MAG TPA: SRPBCC domain-containing protein, partial [Ktedonobacteraceae bacterium]|nr:SRPBCC domain-containing protein [Ktedonobacteraceae bacterium]